MKVVADTGPIVAAANRRDRAHALAVASGRIAVTGSKAQARRFFEMFRLPPRTA